MYTCTYVYIYIYTHMYTHVRIHIHIHIRIYIYIYIYTYLCVYTSSYMYGGTPRSPGLQGRLGLSLGLRVPREFMHNKQYCYY